MRALLIALGNPLRRDDGVAQAVLKLPIAPETESRALFQLTPEVAAELAGFDPVIFIDADASAADVIIEAVNEQSSIGAFTHFASPSEVVALSRSLFGFAGQAFLCRIPANDFSLGEGSGRRAESFVRLAAERLRDLLAVHLSPQCEHSY